MTRLRDFWRTLVYLRVSMLDPYYIPPAYRLARWLGLKP